MSIFGNVKSICTNTTDVGVSFDLFGTLVTAERPNPAQAVAAELTARGVSIPDDWAKAYTTAHVEVSPGAELALSEHVQAALASRDRTVAEQVVQEAVQAAFDREVETRPGAREAVTAARECGPVAICSNCSVSGLVERTLGRSKLEQPMFDAVVTSVGCGWRKPAPEIFEETATQLGVDPANLLHVGDDPRTDSGVEAVGGQFISLGDDSLASLATRLEAISSCG